jgi:hypothetical protein
MIGRRSIVGIAALLALVVCSFAAANASAEQKAYACIEGSTPKEFSDAHCVTPNTTSGTFHLSVEPESSVSITGTNAKTASSTTASTPAVLNGTLSGIETELECSKVSGSGSLTNAAASVSGKGTINYTECIVKKPAGKECLVSGGAVTTNPLTATTVGQAANKLKFSPETGTEFTKIKIEHCTVAALNNSFPVTGTLLGNTSGATTTTVASTVKTEGTLKFGGNPAGLGGSITISASSGSLLGPLVLK